MTHRSSPPRDSAPEDFGQADTLTWRCRYEGLVNIACFRGKQVAGISGPWSGKFALTWWDRPPPQRQLELFDSLDDAQRKVEAWARRMRHGKMATPTTPARQAPPARAESGLLQRLCSALPGFGRHSARAKHAHIERLRDRRDESELDLGDLHFAAGDESLARS